VRISILPSGVLVGAVALVVTAMSVAPAHADETTPASISSVKLAGGKVTGILTVRGAKGTGSIETATLKAEVGRQPAAVTTVPVASAKRATMLVVDTSGSMGAEGMLTVRDAVTDFLVKAPADVSVGLISFAGTAGVDVAPTKDRSKVQRAVNGLASRGETTLYDAVALAAVSMPSFGDRSIVLLSDGGDTASAKATQSSATTALRRNGVRAEVIGFKTGESDNSVLKGFASAGGGTVAAAGNAAAVRTAFDTAAKALESQVSFSVTPPSGAASKQELSLTGTADGRTFRAIGLVDFGASAATTPAPTPSATAAVAPIEAPRFSGPKGFSPLLLIALGALFLGLAGLTAALVVRPSQNSRQNRVAGIEQYVSRPGNSSAAVAKATPSAISETLVQLGERVMEGRESTTKTMALITRADLPLRPGEWWVLRIVAVVVSVSGSLVLFRGGLVATIFALVVGFAAGLLLPAIVLRFLAKRRAKKFESQLPDLLMLAASSLSTGFSLPQALDAIARDASEPAAKEFSRALAETRIGSDVGESLDRMAERMDSDNMRWTSMAITIQRQVGGNLAETLRTTAKTLREREELHRHVRALSAEGRLSAYILIGLPIGLFLYMLKINYDYVSMLWTRPMGWMMLAFGIVAMGLGIFWMRKVVEVEV